MATNKVVINDSIQFEMGDVEMESFLRILQRDASLVMNCIDCGTTIIPQSRSYCAKTGKEEFKVNCVQCNKTHTVRMYGGYGFILPTDDEFYKGHIIGNK